MKNLELFSQEVWNPFYSYGLTNNFWNIRYHTVIFTWVVILFIIFLIFLSRLYLKKENSVGQYLILSFISSFKEQIKEGLGIFEYKHFAFITSLFIFIFLCNIISIFPFIEEPTVDLNTTLGLGIVSFAYVQINSIMHNGFRAYFKEYFLPFFLLFPVNVIGTLSTIISISFRLFGNIFGGAIIAGLWRGSIAGAIILETVGILSGMNLLLTIFFVLFEGFIQAFVFSMLSLTYLSIEVQDEE
jgi:F-type H+-transporting ATPase subunit a